MAGKRNAVVQAALETPSHHSLSEQAKVWLMGSQRCWLAASEIGAAARHERSSPMRFRSTVGRVEIVDAIGWNATGSIVVECKVTRSDFLADKRKPFRTNGEGLGRWRWYLAPDGLIDPQEVPKGWGLMVPTFRGLRKLVRASPFDVTDRSQQKEILVLQHVAEGYRSLAQAWEYTAKHAGAQHLRYDPVNQNNTRWRSKLS